MANVLLLIGHLLILLQDGRKSGGVKKNREKLMRKKQNGANITGIKKSKKRNMEKRML